MFFKLNVTKIKEIKKIKIIFLLIILLKKNMKTTLVYKSFSKNYIYYICKNRKSCKGRGKTNIIIMNS